jgi:putative sigma-54 modulation protein
MKCSFNFKHLDHSDALQEHAQQSLDKIARFLLKDGHAQVWFSKKKDDFIVEILISTADKQFRASSTGDDVYGTVEGTVEKLEKQILKNRKILKNHKHFELSKEGRLSHLTPAFDMNMNVRKAN